MIFNDTKKWVFIFCLVREDDRGNCNATLSWFSRYKKNNIDQKCLRTLGKKLSYFRCLGTSLLELKVGGKRETMIATKKNLGKESNLKEQVGEN